MLDLCRVCGLTCYFVGCSFVGLLSFFARVMGSDRLCVFDACWFRFWGLVGGLELCVFGGLTWFVN